MFVLRIENTKGDILRLSQNEGNYQVIGVEGLTPPESEIYTAEIAGLDGSKYKSSRLEMRNIVVTVKINGDIEANRLALYKVFKIKQYCKIYYTTESRAVYAEGYVETMESDFFSNAQQMQISIVCPFPYFKSASEIVNDISKRTALFEFPFSIDEYGIEFSTLDENRIASVIYSGDVESGCTFKLVAEGTIVNPSILNVDTGERLTLDMTLEDGDIVLINTNKGSKSVKLIQQIFESNIVKYLTPDSKWLTLEIGENRFFYDAESGENELYLYVIMNTLYEGV